MSIITTITPLPDKQPGVWIRFTVVNNGDEDVRMLIVNTPLQGLRSDCLIVTRNNERISYDGPMVKRAAPRPKDFALLTPHESRSEEVDISKAYALIPGGQVVVQFNEECLVAMPAGAIEELREHRDNIAVENQPASILIENAAVVPATLGAKARALDAHEPQQNILLRLLESARIVSRVRNPKIADATPQQKKIISKAHRGAYKLLNKVKPSIPEDKLYQRWFGEVNMSRKSAVETVFKKTKQRLESATFTYHADLSGCSPERNEYAYTYDGSRQVYICHLFWSAPANGMESQAGTLVHEHTHASAHTNDVPGAYGEQACRALARDHPLQATRNADNYEFYCESL